MAYRWFVLLGLWLLYMAFGLAATSLAPIISRISSDLELSHSEIGSILGAWQLVYIFSAVPCGILLDKIGHRIGLSLGMLCLTVSMALRGIADDYSVMLLAVALFGLGGPIISAGAPKVVTDYFTGKDRGLAMGIYMTGPSVGAIVSLTLTHSLFLPLVNDDWRALMLLWAGVCFMCGLSWFFIASFNTQAKAVVSSARVKSSHMFRLIRHHPEVSIVLLMSVGVFLFNHGLNNWLPSILAEGGMTPAQAGLWAAIPTAVGILGSLIIPRLATPEKRFKILIFLCICAATASILLHADNNVVLTTALLLQGIARSALMTVLILTLVELPAIGQRYAGMASGFFFSAAEVGGVLGPLMIGLLFDITGGFSAGLMFLSLVTILTTLGAIALQGATKVKN